MLAACERSLPADVAVCAAAVCDWRVTAPAGQKIKKQAGERPARAGVHGEPGHPGHLEPAQRSATRGSSSASRRKPANVLEHATAKRLSKGCDWMLANDVSPETGTFGGDSNTIHLISDRGVESWPSLSKREVAERLAARIADALDASDASA